MTINNISIVAQPGAVLIGIHRTYVSPLTTTISPDGGTFNAMTWFTLQVVKSYVISIVALSTVTC